MSLVLLDGFEDLSSITSGGGSVVAGRNGNCLASNSSAIAIPTAFQSATVLFGFAFKTISGDVALIELKSDMGATSHNQLIYRAGASAFLEFTRSSTVLGNTGVGSIVNGAWQYVEVQAVLSDTVGSVTIKINGVTKLLLTNQDTKNAGTNTVYDMINLISGYYDDFYLQTGTVSFWGDIVVETLYPNGNGTGGAENSWVGSDSDSVNNYLLVNETGTPVTTDYVQSGTSGNRDIYTLGNLAHTTGTVLGVTHAAFAGTDVGTAQANIVNRTTSTNNLSSALDLTTTYKSFYSSYETDPEGGAWSISKVNGMQVGMQVT